MDEYARTGGEPIVQPEQQPSDTARAIARCVLYEGYTVGLYGRNTHKHQARRTAGGVYPAAYTSAGHPDNPCLMRTECLLEGDGAVDLTISVRFLHVVDRRLLKCDHEDFVDTLTVRGVGYVAGQEAREREIAIHLPAVDFHDDLRHELPVVIEPATTREPLADDAGSLAGWIIRSWESIEASIDARVVPVASGVARICVAIRNQSIWGGGSRDVTQRRTLVAAHTILHAPAGRFVSLNDPPDSLAKDVAACRNVGTWPVLVGTPPARDTMLSSPIIFYDYPHVPTGGLDPGTRAFSRDASNHPTPPTADAHIGDSASDYAG
ncbi:MAG TPA: hypothetical protein VH559_01340 [Gemmatimonadaceae bacterium]